MQPLGPPLKCVGKWVKVGDLPTPRYECTCAMITYSEMVVGGGRSGRDWLKRMDISSIKLTDSAIWGEGMHLINLHMYYY